MSSTKDNFWLDQETLISRYIWAPIRRPDAYCPASLLQMRDANGEIPGIFIVCSFERGPGKTFAFAYKLLRDYLDSGGACKFILIARRQNEVGYVANGMFKSMLNLLYPHWEIGERQQMHGKYSVILLRRPVDGKTVEEEIGYVTPIAAADDLKKVSSVFGDAYQAYFDEFQPLIDWKYIPREIELFETLIKSFGRSNGDHCRFVPVYMASNTVSVMNEYFLSFGISNKIQANTKRYRGNGVVLQIADVPGLAEKHESNPVIRALNTNRERKSDLWLNDNTTNIVKKPSQWGNNYYLATLVQGTQRYGFRVFPDVNIYYIDHRVDPACGTLLGHNLDENPDLPLFRYSQLYDIMKKNLYSGQVYFSSPLSKKIFMSAMVAGK